MAVTVNLFPVTGVTLPLVSMGGSSFLFTCLAIGIILSVARNVEQLEAPADAPKTAGDKKEKKAANAKSKVEEEDEKEEKPVTAKKEKGAKKVDAANADDKEEKKKALKPLTEIAMKDMEQGK
jgi:cell division protein FtsW